MGSGADSAIGTPAGPDAKVGARNAHSMSPMTIGIPTIAAIDFAATDGFFFS